MSGQTTAAGRPPTLVVTLTLVLTVTLVLTLVLTPVTLVLPGLSGRGLPAVTIHAGGCGQLIWKRADENWYQ